MSGLASSNRTQLTYTPDICVLHEEDNDGEDDAPHTKAGWILGKHCILEKEPEIRAVPRRSLVFLFALQYFSLAGLPSLPFISLLSVHVHNLVVSLLIS